MWSYIKHWGDTPPLHPASTERLWGRVVSESDISDSLLKDTWPANQPIPLLIFQLLSFLRSPQWPPSRQGIFSQLPAPLIANNLLFNSLSTHPWTWSCVARVGKKKKNEKMRHWRERPLFHAHYLHCIFKHFYFDCCLGYHSFLLLLMSMFLRLIQGNYILLLRLNGYNSVELGRVSKRWKGSLCKDVFCELWLFGEAFQAFLVVKAATDLLSYFAWQMRWLWFEKKKDTFVSHLEIIVSLLKWLIEGTL